LVPIIISWRDLLLTRKLLNQWFQVVKSWSSIPKFYDRHHDLVNCCAISMPQITTDIFRLS
jgi:hypothetical protein